MIITSRPVNTSQLCVELGRVPLRVVGPDSDGCSQVFAEGVDDEALAAAVEAHAACDEWVDPEGA